MVLRWFQICDEIELLEKGLKYSIPLPSGRGTVERQAADIAPVVTHSPTKLDFSLSGMSVPLVRGRFSFF